jgi:transcriptional regulator with XRE-family HTH domain
MERNFRRFAMEFHEKLQQLRKQNQLTQEQLAEQLYVSRTAVSKWESGKGYPNIESLKCISKLFSVTIDQLLSSDELIVLAETENRININNISNLIYGLLDLSTILFLFLPFYAQSDGSHVRFETLISYNASGTIRLIYFILLILMSLWGAAELTLRILQYENAFKAIRIFSFLLHSIAILLFIMTRQPYITALSFVLLILKTVLFVKQAR